MNKGMIYGLVAAAVILLGIFFLRNGKGTQTASAPSEPAASEPASVPTEQAAPGAQASAPAASEAAKSEVKSAAKPEAKAEGTARSKAETKTKKTVHVHHKASGKTESAQVTKPEPVKSVQDVNGVNGNGSLALEGMGSAEKVGTSMTVAGTSADKPLEISPMDAGKSPSSSAPAAAQAAPAQSLVSNPFHPKIRMTLDGLLTRSMAGTNSALLYNGYGGNFRLEWECLPFLSLGVGTNLAFYRRSLADSISSSFDLLGSLIPINEPGFQGYLLGGLGRNLQAPNKAWVGHNRGFAGIGARFGLFSAWSLDMGLMYDMFSPDAGPMQALDGRLGLSYAFDL